MKKSLPKEKKIEKGTYEHYKGARMEVLGIAYHSETLEQFVLYRHRGKEKRFWIRPHTMFLEKVKINGKNVPRFKLIRKK